MLLTIDAARSIRARRPPRRPSSQAERTEGENAEGAVQGRAAEDRRAIEGGVLDQARRRELLKPGKYRFQVANAGKIEHDLAIEGDGVEEKTAADRAGEEGALEADLKPGKYRVLLHRPGTRAVRHGRST